MVRFSSTNGVEMNGFGRRGKSQSPAEVTSLVPVSTTIRNGSANGQAWRLTKVFNENDEALINRKLPKELLLRIFSHLDVVSLCRCAQVCLNFKLAASSQYFAMLQLRSRSTQKSLINYQFVDAQTPDRHLLRQKMGESRSQSIHYEHDQSII